VNGTSTANLVLVEEDAPNGSELDIQVGHEVIVEHRTRRLFAGAIVDVSVDNPGSSNAIFHRLSLKDYSAELEKKRVAQSYEDTGSPVTQTVGDVLRSIRAVPQNWWRSAACVDSKHPPELLPGIDVSRPEHKDLGILRPWNTLQEVVKENWNSPSTLFLAAVFYLPTYLSFFLCPALLYRWSLKGTTLVHSPLIWIVHGAFKSHLRERLEEIRELVRYRLMRLYSAAVLVFFLSKVLLFSMWSSIAEWWNNTPPAEFLNAYLAPLEIPRWHIAAAVNSLLAWVLFFMADHAVARYKREAEVNEGRLDTIVQSVTLIRGILTLYTIGTGLYIAASLVEKWGLPPIGEKWFPW